MLGSGRGWGRAGAGDRDRDRGRFRGLGHCLLLLHVGGALVGVYHVTLLSKGPLASLPYGPFDKNKSFKVKLKPKYLQHSL